MYLAGVATKIHVLVMTLGYSRRAYAEGFLHERMPNLLAAHAFASFPDSPALAPAAAATCNPPASEKDLG